jgi:hypothetical protein
MNTLLFLAGIISFVVGLIHSVLGEVLIFKHLRNGTVIPTVGEPLLRERNIRILWASWHIVTIFGWAIGGVLLKLSYTELDINENSYFIVHLIAYAMLASSVFVLIATKGKHPGWLGLLAVAILCWLA